MDFKNKVVLVTGASSGIGAATAVLFSTHSAKLALVGRNVGKLNDVANTCEKSKGVKPLIIVADLEDPSEVERTAKETIDYYGRLDVLVNNAGAGSRATLEDLDLNKFDSLMALNVRSVLLLTKLLLPELIKSRGNVVNISSLVTTLFMPDNLAYGLTKAALDHFTKTLAKDVGRRGVRVNSVNPGFTLTNFHRAAGFDEAQYSMTVATVEKMTPLGKAIESEEIANMVVYLASDLAKNITGQKIFIDGGLQF